MHTKRMTIPQTWTNYRKERKWAMTPLPGPHKKFESMPLGMLIRDGLKLAANTKEVKNILTQGLVKVDGKIIKNKNWGIGIMDSVQIGDKSYRVMPSTKGLKLIQIPEKEANLKLVKVIKKTMNGKKVQLNLHDGRNLFSDKKDIKVGDSLLITVPDMKVEKHLPIKENTEVMIISGKRSGTIATLKGRKKILFHPDAALLEKGKNKFETTFDYLMVVGEVKVSE